MAFGFTNTETTHWTANGSVSQGNLLTREFVANKPSAVASGGVLLVGIHTRVASGDISITPASGFTLLGSRRQVSTILFVYAKATGGSEPSTYSFQQVDNGITSGNNAVTALWIADASADPILDTTVTVAGSDSSQSITLPGQTTVTDGALLFAFAAGSHGNRLPSVDGSYMTGATPIFARVADTGSGGVRYYCAFFEQATEGATGDKLYDTISTDNQNNMGVMVAIRPGSVEAPAPTHPFTSVTIS